MTETEIKKEGQEERERERERLKEPSLMPADNLSTGLKE